MTDKTDPTVGYGGFPPAPGLDGRYKVCDLEGKLHDVTEKYLASREKAELKDSGTRRQFATGAVRDMAKGKGAFHLMGIHGIMRYALQLEKGAAKYGERNWEKGQPLSCYADSALRHLMKHIAGYDDEDHLSAAIWNLLNLAEGEERIKQGIWPKELDDLPKTFAGKEPRF